MLTPSAASCQFVRPHLEAFADGELRGDLLRRVSAHIDDCGACTDAVERIQGLGAILREHVSDVDPDDLAGLADGVVSRIRAEDRESWRGKLERATDDLYWVMVGAGSIAAAFLTAASVSLVMHSSVEQRGDSLAAVLNTAISLPQLGGTTIVPDSVSPDSIVSANGKEDVEFANLTEVNRAGHVMRMQTLPVGGISPADAQPLVNQLRTLRFAQPERTTLDPESRQFIWLHTATEVRGTEMGLDARRTVWLYTTPKKKVL